MDVLDPTVPVASLQFAQSTPPMAPDSDQVPVNETKRPLVPLVSTRTFLPPLPSVPRQMSADYHAAVQSTLADLGLGEWDTNRFQLGRLLGQGMYGRVYVARDLARPRSSRHAKPIVQAVEKLGALRRQLDEARKQLLDVQPSAVQVQVSVEPALNWRTVPLVESKQVIGVQDTIQRLNQSIDKQQATIDRLQTVAVKQIPKSRVSLQLVLNELRALRQLAPACHPYIVCFDGGFYQDAQHYYLVTEYLDDYVSLDTLIPDLAKQIADPKNDLDRDRAVEIIVNLISGLAVIHRRGVAHRDVKPANILVERHGPKIKFIDFGLSCTYSFCNAARLDLGTLSYLPPELLLPKDFLLPSTVVNFELIKKSDMWALGLTIAALVSTAMQPWVAEAWGQTYWKATFRKFGQPGLDTILEQQQLTQGRWMIEQFVRYYDYVEPTDTFSHTSHAVEELLAKLTHDYATRHPTTPRPYLTLTPLLQRSVDRRRLPSVFSRPKLSKADLNELKTAPPPSLVERKTLGKRHRASGMGTDVKTAKPMKPSKTFKPPSTPKEWLRHLSKILPMEGRVSKSGEYAFLKLPDDWQTYQDLLVNISHTAFRSQQAAAQQRFYDEYKVGKRKVRFRWIKPLAPIGLHITLDKDDVGKSDLNSTVTFSFDSVDHLTVFPPDTLKISGFSPESRPTIPLLWAVWDVSLLSSLRCDYHCHISLAAYVAQLV